jgi:hypothetical protein
MECVPAIKFVMSNPNVIAAPAARPVLVYGEFAGTVSIATFGINVPFVPPAFVHVTSACIVHVPARHGVSLGVITIFVAVIFGNDASSAPIDEIVGSVAEYLCINNQDTYVSILYEGEPVPICIEVIGSTSVPMPRVVPVTLPSKLRFASYR